MAANRVAKEALAAVGQARKQPPPTNLRGKTPPSGRKSPSTRQCWASAPRVTDRYFYPPVVPKKMHAIGARRTLAGERSTAGVNYSLRAYKWRTSQVYKVPFQSLRAPS